MGMRLVLPLILFGETAHVAEVCPTCGHVQSTALWLMIGFLGQAIFTARFLAQWLVSEKRRDSVIPVAFWWLSLFGGMTLLCYAVHREDPVIIVGQALGVFIYVRNLMLVSKGKKRAVKSSHRSSLKGPHRVELIEVVRAPERRERPDDE
ncbi:MAG: putative rane protein [Planctomycetota bacterium]|nr:putative rane protein [Planctomycetota bacterium]